MLCTHGLDDRFWPLAAYKPATPKSAPRLKQPPTPKPANCLVSDQDMDPRGKPEDDSLNGSSAQAKDD